MTEQMEITIEILRARVESSSATYLDIYFARDFAIFADRPETEILSVVRGLITREPGSGRGKYERATRYACDRILYWYENAHSYTLNDLVGFVASHDPACVYAVLLGKAATLAV